MADPPNPPVYAKKPPFVPTHRPNEPKTPPKPGGAGHGLSGSVAPPVDGTPPAK